MPSFKPKTTKKIKVDVNSNVTLDGKHKQMIAKFKEDEEKLPKLLQKKSIIKKKLSSKSLKIDDRLKLEEELFNIRESVKDIKHARTNYYLDNSKYIFDYFERKKSISKDNNTKQVLNSFFNISTEESEEQRKNEQRSINDVTSYLRNVDESFIDINNFIINNEHCEWCKTGEMIPIDHEGLLVCNNCSRNKVFLVENEKPSYKEPPKEVCFYAYKRINHFREILAQFQAKESTQIPPQVIEDIKLQIIKERISLEQLSNKKTKDILKKLGYNKYYEHIPFIKDKLGIKPPIMSPELEETLCNLFMDIQAPYAKYCPDDRVNFLNYYYTVYKLCELLDQRQFLPFFPMLKDREKRIEQDEIWKKICSELDWEFIPTI
tara:strand:- start:21622 stop:22752 length:1131 start_codon:yes stop_codon:yes gene_type:complete